jgi:hypothetical protein
MFKSNLLIILSLIGALTFLTGEENYSVIKLEGKDNSASETIRLRSGEIAETVKVHNFSFDSLTYKVTYGDNNIFRPQGETVYGPATLTIVGNKEEGAGFAYIVVKILSSSKETKNTLGTVKLPESSKQKVDIFIEESNDLKHWHRSQPGIYKGSSQAKYFRANMESVKETTQN